VLADEGMWTFDKLPLRQLKETYGFEPPTGWVEHLQSSAVRFNSGGSGSFVSPDGLVMTNPPRRRRHAPEDQHRGQGLLQDRLPRQEVRRRGEGARPRIERPGRHRGRDRRGQPPPSSRAWTTHRPTPPVAGRWPNLRKIHSTKTAAERRRHPLSRRQVRALHLQEVHRRPPGLRPRVRHRLFGGDPDNLEYIPIHLDVASFRAYEDGKPANPSITWPGAPPARSKAS